MAVQSEGIQLQLGTISNFFHQAFFQWIWHVKGTFPGTIIKQLPYWIIYLEDLCLNLAIQG